MKNSRSCTKCKSQELMIMTKSNGSVILPIWPYSSVRVRSFVCTSCGFTEDWVAETKDLGKLRVLATTYRDKLIAFKKKINL